MSIRPSNAHPNLVPSRSALRVLLPPIQARSWPALLAGILLVRFLSAASLTDPGQGERPPATPAHTGPAARSANRAPGSLSPLPARADTAAADLIPNPSFESHVACPQRISQLGLARPWQSVAPGNEGADYFHACAGRSPVGVPYNFAGLQAPRTGDAYAGLFVYNPADTAYREFLRVPLGQPLRAGQSYEAVMYVSRADLRTLAVGGLGLYFSAEPPSLDALKRVSPQVVARPPVADATEWTRIRGRFRAEGGEAWLSIGRFGPADGGQVQPPPPARRPVRTVAAAFYYVDDVSVYPVVPRLGE